LDYIPVCKVLQEKLSFYFNLGFPQQISMITSREAWPCFSASQQLIALTVGESVIPFANSIGKAKNQ